MAATEGMDASPGWGRIALAQRAVTLPDVSEPSSVVRSMQRIATSRAHSLDDFLIDLLAREAARSSAPTSSTLRTPRSSEPKWESESAVATSIRILGGASDDHFAVGARWSRGINARARSGLVSETTRRPRPREGRAEWARRWSRRRSPDRVLKRAVPTLNLTVSQRY